MIKVYHLEKSRSLRLIWLLEELGLKYEVIEFKRDPKTYLAPKEFKKIHPLGKAPILEDGGKIIAESALIFEYLLDTYDKENKLHPSQEDSEYLNYRYWMHFSEGSLMGPLVMSLILNKIKEASLPFFIKPIAKKIVDEVYKGYLSNQLETLFSFIDDHLNRRDYFVGQSLSAADLLMSFPLMASSQGRVDLTAYKNVQNFVTMCETNEKYLEICNKYAP